MKRIYSSIVLLLFAAMASADAKPLKVFILAGQSNMEGHAKVETFDYIGDDPATAPLLKLMRGSLYQRNRVAWSPFLQRVATRLTKVFMGG